MHTVVIFVMPIITNTPLHVHVCGMDGMLKMSSKRFRLALTASSHAYAPGQHPEER